MEKIYNKKKKVLPYVFLDACFVSGGGSEGRGVAGDTSGGVRMGGVGGLGPPDLSRLGFSRLRESYPAFSSG